MGDREPRHIVVVDDEPNFRRFVVRVLKGEGFRVAAAGGFASAIKLIEQDQSVDLLIADIGLGPASPHGVVLSNMARLRRNRLKVILMSGSYDVHLVAQYGNAIAVLQKPFTGGQLLEVVTAAVGERV